MNKPRHLSVAGAIRSRIARGGEDRLWTYADFPHRERMAIAAALSRLSREGLVRRLRRGLYYRPRITVLGPSRPDPQALFESALRLRGARAVPSGIGQFGRLGLTTQSSNVASLAVPWRVTSSPLPGIPARLTVRPLEKQRGIRPDERTTLDALRDLERIPDSSAAAAVERLMTLVLAGRLDYGRLARFALAEPPRVRAVLGALGEEVRSRRGARRRVTVHALDSLRTSLNPLTSFRIRGLADALRHAARWRIRA